MAVLSHLAACSRTIGEDQPRKIFQPSRGSLQTSRSGLHEVSTPTAGKRLSSTFNEEVSEIPSISSQRSVRGVRHGLASGGNTQHYSNLVDHPTGDVASVKPSESTAGTVVSHLNRHLLPEKYCGLEMTTKIYGGKEVDIDEFPWMALIRKSNGTVRSFTCGGSLITNRYVLTAAHCVNGMLDKVRLGEHDLRSLIDCQGRCNFPPEDISISKIIVHHGYVFEDKKKIHDIALIRLKKPVRLSAFILPICLPLDQLQTRIFVGKSMWVAGWGSTETNEGSPIKLKVKLPVRDNEVCANNYQSVEISDSDICAGGEKNMDSCIGDSGGPLMTQELIAGKVRWVQYGIVSSGKGDCGMEGNPAVYTSVAAHLDWILDNIRK